MSDQERARVMEVEQVKVGGRSLPQAACGKQVAIGN